MGEVSPDTESVSESLSDQARPGFRKHDSYIEAIRSVIFDRNTGWPQKYVSEKMNSEIRAIIMQSTMRKQDACRKTFKTI